MNEHQQTAMRHPCRLAVETVHPQFAYKNGTHSVVLTINSGYESIEAGFGGPVWHASASMLSGWPTDKQFLRTRALAALDGVGDESKGQWEEWGDVAYHVKRRLSTAEHAIVGDTKDIRKTKEADTRRSAVLRFLPPHMRNWRE